MPSLLFKRPVGTIPRTPRNPFARALLPANDAGCIRTPMKDTCYLTTAIDYTNAAPHLGHAYEKILTDAMARYQRLRGKKVFFLTGVDQHGQKIQQSAEKAGIHPATHVKKVTKLFLRLLEALNISNDGWIETTSDLHKKAVQKLLQDLHDKGQLYKASRTGFYSERAEQFVTDKERGPDGNFGAEWGEVVELEEENYYFRLSEHIPWLVEFLKKTPDFVLPDSRMTNLVKSLEEAPGDLCISRPKSRLRWGIDLPFDPDYVTYVWFDALTNYISAAGWEKDSAEGLPEFSSLWPCDAHVIGKDILVPAHGVYWPIMLHAAGFPDEAMPKIVAHGWWNIRGEKMSKSTGNVVDPMELAAKYGADGLRYYLLSDMTTGQDADFNLDRLVVRYNSELANGLGNLLNRTLSMSARYCEAMVTVNSYEDDLGREVIDALAALPAAYHAPLEKWQFNRAIEALIQFVNVCNRYTDKTEPFRLAKDPESAPRVQSILQHLIEALAHISIYLTPVCPDAAKRIQEQLRWTPPAALTFDTLAWGLIPDGHEHGKPKPLFPRIEAEPAAEQ